jgi:hypothetical protein
LGDVRLEQREEERRRRFGHKSPPLAARGEKRKRRAREHLGEATKGRELRHFHLWTSKTIDAKKPPRKSTGVRHDA